MIQLYVWNWIPWILNWQGGSDSEQESNEDIGTSRKPQKRARVKSREQTSKGSEGPLSDRLQFQSASGCLSLLKKRRTGVKSLSISSLSPSVTLSLSLSVCVHAYILLYWTLFFEVDCIPLLSACCFYAIFCMVKFVNLKLGS